jgi:hypothetical protein
MPGEREVLAKVGTGGGEVLMVDREPVVDEFITDGVVRLLPEHVPAVLRQLGVTAP